ncbi:MAG TPA: zinc ribbon domain-containing protein [Chloroflexota bacterium]|nr:zinc ribbon domain-containing protein [Chloroflexota bacterium]
MPLYEFACGACGGTFERLLSFQAASNGVTCPRCGAAPARRLLSLFAAVSKSSAGETTAVAGAGGCACSTGGGCACGCAH